MKTKITITITNRRLRENDYAMFLLLIIIDCCLLCGETSSYKIVDDRIGTNKLSKRDTDNNDGGTISITQEQVAITPGSAPTTKKKTITDTDSEHDQIEYADNVEEQEEKEDDDSAIGSQNFFQSFAPLFAAAPLTHSRPLLYPDQTFRGSYRHGSFRELPFNSIGNGNDNLLGSGNFGVIKGGTYYANADQDDVDFGLDDVSSAGYTSYLGNGHSRPAYYKRNPLPAYRNGGDFFANFRDFADIMTPTKSAFSQYYVVYVNGNSSKDENVSEPDMTKLSTDNLSAVVPSSKEEKKRLPNNILERLTMLDDVENNIRNNINGGSNDNTKQDTYGNEKLSESKRKLIFYNGQLKNKENKFNSKLSSTSSIELADPLVALSR